MNITGEIRYFLGKGDYAHLKFSESGSALSIDILLVPAAHRKQGIGTLLIERVIALADALGKDIFVTARPIGASGEAALSKLVRYYVRFGFTIADRGISTAYMVREKAPRVGCKETSVATAESESQ